MYLARFRSSIPRDSVLLNFGDGIQVRQTVSSANRCDIPLSFQDDAKLVQDVAPRANDTVSQLDGKRKDGVALVRDLLSLLIID